MAHGLTTGGNVSIPALLLLLGLPGCKVLAPGTDPEITVPARYAAGPVIPPHGATGWLDEFSDPALNRLVDDAMRYNNDLAVSAGRLKEARANVRLVGATARPQISASGNASRRKSAAEIEDGMGNRRVIDSHANSFSVGADLSWEIDLWGRLQNRRKAAAADLRAAAADHYGFKLSLAATVARAWFRLAESELQVRLARDTLESLRKNLNFLERGVDLGTSEVLDLRLTRANVEAATGNLEAQRRQHDEATRSLEVLLGRYPTNRLRGRDDLPEARARIPAGLPSELLNRRPDLVAARRRLIAASERVVEAQKDFLPSIRLTGGTGTSSEQLRRLLDPNLLAWSIAGGASQPVVQGGRLRGNLEAARARYDQALAGFRQVALQAFREVETALAADAFLKRQVDAQERTVAESTAAEELAWDQYSNGLVDGLTWLEAQRRSFNSKSALLQLRNLRLQNRIDLHLALGGDFKTRPKPGGAAN